MSLRRLNFSPGDTLLLQERPYQFRGEISQEGAGLRDPRALSFTDAHTAAPVTLTPEAFDQLYAAGEVRILKAHEPAAQIAPVPDAAGETETQRWRRLWCEAFDAAPCGKSDQALASFIAAHAADLACGRAPPSPGALRVWLRERGRPGDRRARFMAHRIGPISVPLRLEPSAQQVLAQEAERFFDGVRVNPHAVYCAVRARIADLNGDRSGDALPPIRSPSESTVRRYLRRHLDYGRATRRLGWREGGRRFQPILGSMKAERILELAIVDQTRIDCAVIDDEHMINVGRPWLAMMIDVRSRYPLGYQLSFEPPSVSTVLACVRHAVRPKLEHPEVAGEWMAFGVPETIVVDNAWENTGSSFRDACADANISILFAPVAAPEYKGVGERFFGTLNTLLFHRLPGGLPFTPQQRTKLGLDMETDAALMLSDVKRAIHQCIVEVYGREFHKALGAAPEQLWRREAPLHGRPYVEDLAALDLALARLAPSERTLSRAGVTHQELTYNSPEALAQLLADLLPRQSPRSARPGTVRVKLKYHPEDLGQVYVWNPVRRRYAQLACTQAEYAQGLSEHHHALIRAFARSEQLAFQSEDERCRARKRLQDLVLPSIPLGKVRERQNAQRLKLGVEPARTWPSGLPEHGVPLGSTAARTDEGTPHRAPRPRRKPAKAQIVMGVFEPVTAPASSPSAFAEFFGAEEWT